jgi:hypothetical protein
MRSLDFSTQRTTRKYDHGLEVGPQQDPSRLQRAFRRCAAALLIVHSQTELALNTNTIVSGMDRNVTKILGIVSNTSGAGARVREGISSEHLSVSIACTLFITERTLTIA